MAICSIADCGKGAICKGLCKSHYDNFRRKGTATPAPYDERRRQEFHACYARAESECWEWTGHVDATGYGRFSIRGQQKHSHRIAWEYANGPIPRGMYVCHRCDNRRCVNPDHLFLGSHLDNIADMVSKGRQQQAEKHGLAKLTASDVKEIREANDSQRALARRFAISPSQISDIRNNKAWRSVA